MKIYPLLYPIEAKRYAQNTFNYSPDKIANKKRKGYMVYFSKIVKPDNH